ncbi:MULTISPECIES: recombinase family protein [Flammeovirga]|uniref:Recombinase family protein n=1 Tax=Flammeovirga agarivorans TaxID=2726742 RepID=A0A7X8SJ35_9BACT|nr:MULTISPECIES: recombinase family protein [Flammeovirga]NLR91170.1 recombinase family protein [Flammeovirga agarivorans]
MSTFTYLRVSTVAQSKFQQQAKIKGKPYIDKCPVTLPFVERPRAKELLEILSAEDTLYIGDIDRLGDNPKDILDALKALYATEAIVNIYKFETTDEEARVGIKAVISAFETMLHMKEYQVHEKTVEGIARAKAEGKYKGGKKGRKMNYDRWSDRNKDVIEGLQSGLTTKEISELTGVGKTQVSRVRKRLREIEAEKREALQEQTQSLQDSIEEYQSERNLMEV